MSRLLVSNNASVSNEIRQTGKRLNVTLSAYIRNVLRKELDAHKQRSELLDFSKFQGMWKKDKIS